MRKRELAVAPADETERLVDRAAVLRITGLKSGTFGAIEYYGRGPAFIRLGPRLKRYRLSDVLAWLAARREVPTGQRREEDASPTEAR